MRGHRVVAARLESGGSGLHGPSETFVEVASEVGLGYLSGGPCVQLLAHRGDVDAGVLEEVVVASWAARERQLCDGVVGPVGVDLIHVVCAVVGHVPPLIARLCPGHHVDTGLWEVKDRHAEQGRDPGGFQYRATHAGDSAREGGGSDVSD